MGKVHYSAARASKSLAHFLLGKAGSALTGIAYFVLLVRHMDTQQYGAYVALIAMLDLFYLSTGLGLSTLAQRYVPEFRIKATSRLLRRFLARLIFRRIAYSLASLLLLGTAAIWLLPAAGVDVDRAIVPWIAMLLVTSASVFLLDEILGALLFQGIAQGLLMARTATKLIIVALLIPADLVDIRHILIAECAVTALSLCVGHVLLARRLRNSAASEAGSDDYANDTMHRTAWRFYLIQLIGQSYGPNLIKLLVSRVLGLAQTGALGFAQSMADMVRNYLPAHLLANWIRPIMVSRFLARRNPADLADIASLVIKLNLFGLLPAAAFMLVCGDAFAAWVTAGKYPAAGNLLVLLLVMVGMQTVHLMYTMIALTMEQPAANLKATLAASLGLPVTLLLIYAFGVEGAAAGLVASEVIWLSVAAYQLAGHGFQLNWDLRGGARLAVAGCASGAAIWALGPVQAYAADVVMAAVVSGAVFVSVSALLKPLREAERALICGIVPKRFVVW